MAYHADVGFDPWHPGGHSGQTAPAGDQNAVTFGVMVSGPLRPQRLPPPKAKATMSARTRFQPLSQGQRRREVGQGQIPAVVAGGSLESPPGVDGLKCVKNMQVGQAIAHAHGDCGSRRCTGRHKVRMASVAVVSLTVGDDDKGDTTAASTNHACEQPSMGKTTSRRP